MEEDDDHKMDWNELKLQSLKVENWKEEISERVW